MAFVSQEKHLEAEDLNRHLSSSMGVWLILSLPEQGKLSWHFPRGWFPIFIWWPPLKLLPLALSLLTHPPWLPSLTGESPLFLPLDYGVAIFLEDTLSKFFFLWGRENAAWYPQDKSLRLWCHLHGSGKSSGPYMGVIPWLSEPFVHCCICTKREGWYGRMATNTNFEVWEICVAMEKLQTALCLIFNTVK